MCGITGFVDLRREQSEQGLISLARRMAATMAHRGPDDEGAWVDPKTGVALGFRRLSILDLTPAGHQPMISASGRSVLAFNGEIYNAEEIRPHLIERGIVFRGHSDTEILLEHLEAFGFVQTLESIVGMFAIAWHDRRDGSVWLARDRMGEKPLYLGRFGQTIMFTSELRSFQVHPDFKAEVDAATLSSYVRFGYVPQPRAIFRNVEMLPPGGFARIDANGTVTVRRYWEAEKVAAAAKASPFIGSEEDAIEELEVILKRAVKGCMVSDVPLGAFLSGGIDSSTIAALMQAASSRPIRTFSIGFDVKGFDEAPYARAVAQHLGTTHEELYFSEQEMLELVPKLPDIWDEPFADSSQLPTLMVSRMARSHVTVALTGDGGDELFGGYQRYGQIETVAETLNRIGPVVAPAGRFVHRLMNVPQLAPVRALIPAGFRGKLDRWSGRIGQATGNNAFENIYIRMASQGLPAEELLVSPSESLDAVWRGVLAEDFPDWVERAQIIDTLSYLPSDILTKVDRASMAVSLEARAPLLDHRVLEFAWRLPKSMKRRTGDSKWVLKQVLLRYVPPALVERPKMGFGVPIDVWLRGALRDWAEELISERRLRREGVFRVETVRSLWERHQQGETWQYALWTVLMFQAWRERWGV